MADELDDILQSLKIAHTGQGCKQLCGLAVGEKMC